MVTMDAEPYWRFHDELHTSRQALEAWSFDWEMFDGAWIMDDCTADLDEELAARSLGLLVVVRVVASAVRRQLRAEDLSDDVAEALEYIEALCLSAHDSRQLCHLLGALTPFHPDRVAEQLLAAAWSAHAQRMDRTARSLSELAYETSCRYGGGNATAHGAALAIGRLARLDECPFTARRWRGIAYVHGRRAARRSIVASPGGAQARRDFG